MGLSDVYHTGKLILRMIMILYNTCIFSTVYSNHLERSTKVTLCVYLLERCDVDKLVNSKPP